MTFIFIYFDNFLDFKIIVDNFHHLFQLIKIILLHQNINLIKLIVIKSI